MSPTTHAASDQRATAVATEVRSPIEVILARVITWVFGVIIAFIGVRFVLELFGANVQAGFVRFVYGVSDIFMAPFVAVFNTQRVQAATFEWSALVAIAVYVLIAWGLIELIRAISPREAASTVETRQEDRTARTP